MADDTTTDAGGNDAADGAQQQEQGKTFTQAEVDQLIAQRADRIARTRYPDYDALKEKAEGAKTLEDRLAEVEGRYKASETKALRSDVATRFGITAEDRDLFLTGTDEESLTAQAKRLADRITDVKKHGNVAPREGAISTTGESGAAEMRDFLQRLTGAN